jgi:riboflavin synthase
MFTGIVEEVGTLRAAGPLEMVIGASRVLEGTAIGDSIAVNGVCLTVTRLEPSAFAVDVVPETRRLTNLGEQPIGAALNLERSLTPDSRMGGHIVQGHVEGTALVEAIDPDGDATRWRFSADAGLVRYVVKKGFVCLDGMSLTVIAVGETGFAVTIIPHTRAVSAWRERQAGQRVNLETDVLGRYVERLLAPLRDNGAAM